MPSRVQVEFKRKRSPVAGRTNWQHRCGGADSIASTVTYRIASELDELESCLMLVHEAYLNQGIIDPHPARLRVIRHHTVPTTEVLMATMGGKVVCTSTLVRDGRLGLPMESIFGEEVAIRRRSGKALAEASCLAHAPDVKLPLSVIVGIMAMTVQCAKYRGTDELLAVVHPHHADFYRGFLGFEPFGTVRPYASVRNNPAIALSLDLNGIQKTNPRGYKRLFGNPFRDDVLRYRPLPSVVHDFLKYLYERPVNAEQQTEPVTKECAQDPCHRADAL